MRAFACCVSRCVLDTKTRLELVAKFRENLSIVHTSEYEPFLRELYPVFAQTLRDTVPPSLVLQVPDISQDMFCLS